MPDVHSQEQRHKNMAAIHSASTEPERRLRQVLWRLGFRYRINVKSLPGSPDIVLSKYRTVIFVHGCFWHGHKDCKYYSVPKTNTDFWKAKIARNQERDQDVWRQLEAQGWSVIVIWECQLKKAVLENTISRIEAEIFRGAEIFQRSLEERRKVKEVYRREMRDRNEREAELKAEFIKKYKR